MAQTFLADVAAMFYLVPKSELTGVRTDFVLRATPIFFLFVMIEFAVGLLRGVRLYRFNDFIASVALGLVQQLTGLTAKVLATHFAFGTAYDFVYTHYRVADWSPSSWATYALALLGVDFLYYVFHRCAHEWHGVWAAHVVHHSGEDYNLGTALRQGALQLLNSWVFNIPLALVGLPPGPFMAHASMNLLYQFWIHTTLIGSLGPLEYILNTPSHHRMHHRPPGNCNYAGVLIIWDRIFGTFVPEDVQRDRYGLAQPLRTFDAVAANAEHWNRLRDVGVSRTSLFGRCAALLRRRVAHRWVFDPAGLFRPFPPTQRSLWVLPAGPERSKYDGGRVPYALNVYVACHMLVLLAAGVYALACAAALPLGAALSLVAALVASTSALGGLLDDPWRTGTETARVAALAALCAWAPEEWLAAALPPGAWPGILQQQPDALVALRSTALTLLIGGWWLALRFSPCVLPATEEEEEAPAGAGGSPPLSPAQVAPASAASGAAAAAPTHPATVADSPPVAGHHQRGSRGRQSVTPRRVLQLRRGSTGSRGAARG